MPNTRVLFIGWDAADWKVIRPLLDAGQLPNLARLIAQGVHGNIATLHPPLSPMLWTSIATGKRPYKHGIHGFSEPLPDGSGVRPVSLLSRKTKAVWNILNQAGHRCIVVGWWPSHPAEPLNGVMISNHFHQSITKPGAPTRFRPGTVHPPSLAPSLAEFRIDPTELSGEFIRPFVPDYEKVDQAKDKRLHTLGKIIAETMSIHAVATELLEKQTWDFAAIYYSSIDHFGHAFMKYHPPRLAWVPEEDFALYQHVIANAYRYHDAMLGSLLAFADANTTVILTSDHGFHPDHLRPGYIPAEPAGPAVEHRHFGVLCLKGPTLKANESIYGASLLDLCPTVLTLFGLPPGKDMDGKVLVTAFKEPPRIEPIESWDSVPGDAGTHPADTQLDPAESAEAFRQLVELGYVAPPGHDARQNIEECIRELNYNLARACQDGGRTAQAAALARDLWTRWPREHRFGFLLADCLAALNQAPQRRQAIEELARRIDRFQLEAKDQLARRGNGSDPDPEPDKPPTPAERRRKFEERQLKELAAGRPRAFEWLQASQALLEKNRPEARRWIYKVIENGTVHGGLSRRLAAAAAALGDLPAARTLLEGALELDPEDAQAHGQLAGIFLKLRQLDNAIASAANSLTLVYFQPGIHAILGRALMKSNRFAEAEQELLVAVAQNPRHFPAHKLLAVLYRHHLNRPSDAFAHEGRALSLRNELVARRRAQNQAPRPSAPDLQPAGEPPRPGPESHSQDANRIFTGSANDLPPPFPPDVDNRQSIIVVSGLPRSGTSLMMQLLIAAGRIPLHDGKRAPDQDNPLGYFEFEKALTLARDVSWVPQARGKVVKIVAQLLPLLPRNEHYHVVFMERNLDEVVASQNAMLARQGRNGARLDDRKLRETYRAQLHHVRRQLSARPEIRTLPVNYPDLLHDPHAGSTRIARFLGPPFDAHAAAKTIRPELRRQKSPSA